MSVDYQINLSKDLTSSPEERSRYYSGMLIYLLVCAVLLVLSGYFMSVNLKRYMTNKQELKRSMASAESVSGLSGYIFNHPDQDFEELQSVSGELASLRSVLGVRTRLLPIIHNLFQNMPSNTELENLAANREKVAFRVNVTAASKDKEPSVSELTTAWENNEELMRYVSGFRALKAQRSRVGSRSIYNIHYECTLKK